MSNFDQEFSVVDGAETTEVKTQEERHTHSVTHRRGQYGPEVVEVCEQVVIKRIERITPLVMVKLTPKLDISIDLERAERAGLVPFDAAAHMRIMGFDPSKPTL